MNSVRGSVSCGMLPNGGGINRGVNIGGFWSNRGCILRHGVDFDAMKRGRANFSSLFHVLKLAMPV